MSDITINNDKNQDDKQKTTPVTKSHSKPSDSNLSLPGDVLQFWLGMRDSNPRSWDQNPLPYRLANPQYSLIVYSHFRTLSCLGSGHQSWDLFS